MGVAEMCFLRAISDYRMKNCKHNNDARELGITYINTIRNCQRKWLQHFKRMPINQMAKLLYLYKPKEGDTKNMIKIIVLTLVNGTGQEINLGWW
jgi:hypothetical protein